MLEQEPENKNVPNLDYYLPKVSLPKRNFLDKLKSLGSRAHILIKKGCDYLNSLNHNGPTPPRWG